MDPFDPRSGWQHPFCAYHGMCALRTLGGIMVAQVTNRAELERRFAENAFSRRELWQG